MIQFPNKKYQIIYADPPWRYRDKGCNGNAESHYSTMKLQDICDLPVQSIQSENCILFLWATYPLYPEALEVIQAWGFTYKSIGFQWVKLNKKALTPFYGLGRWTRGNTEPCLIATKGTPHRIARNVFQLIQEPIEGHSKKPNKVRDEIIKLMGNLPRIELFARQKTDGWDVWGNEVESSLPVISPPEMVRTERQFGGDKIAPVQSPVRPNENSPRSDESRQRAIAEAYAKLKAKK